MWGRAKREGTNQPWLLAFIKQFPRLPSMVYMEEFPGTLCFVTKDLFKK